MQAAWNKSNYECFESNSKLEETEKGDDDGQVAMQYYGTLIIPQESNWDE